MKTWLVLLFSLSIVFKLDAQSLTHELSSDSILLGNYFTYEISLTNAGTSVDYPNLEAFEILSGPNVSQSMSYVNGDMTSSKGISWKLRPIELGQYFIEPISAKHKDTILEADAIELNVYPNPDGIIQEQGNQNSLDDFFNMKRPPLMDRIDPIQKEETKKPKRELKKG